MNITITAEEYQALKARSDALLYVAGVVSSIPSKAKRDHLKCSLATINRKLIETGVKQ